MIEFEREYKGHTIKLTGDFEFSADNVGRFPTMKQLEAAIDDLERKVYIKTPAIMFDEYGMNAGGVIEVVATRPHGRGSVWIKIDGKRKTSSSVYADTAENRALLAEVCACRDRIKVERERIDGLMSRLTRVELREAEK